MPVHLIVARCGAHAALAGDLPALDKGDIQVLLDRTEDVPLCSVAVRVGENLAIGRRENDRATWWVTTPTFKLQPPHILWSEPGLFRPDGEGSLPTGVDIGKLWERTTAGGESSTWLNQIVSIVRLLRESTGPLAWVIDAPHDALEAAGMLLAVFLGSGLTLSIGHPEPDPNTCRLSIGPEVRGYPLVPDPLPGAGDDRVALFIQERLRTQPNLLLAVDGLTEAVVETLLAEERLSEEQTDISATMVTSLQDGAPINEALIDELVSTTLLHQDPTPWEILAYRPEAERRAVVMGLMRRASEFTPTRAFLDAFMSVVPRGMPLAPLCSTLLDWMRRAPVPSIVGAHLETALTEWPQEAGRANRASLWTEAVRILVQGGHHREAVEAVCGTVSTRMIEEGSGAAVALMWMTLPPEHQNPVRLAQLTTTLARHPKGDHAAAMLLRSLRGDAIGTFCQHWIGSRGKSAIRPSDEVLQLAVNSNAILETWLQAIHEQHGTRTIREGLSTLITDPADPRWTTIHAVLSAGESAVDALHLAGALPGMPALEPIAKALLLPALADLRFPDAQLAQSAARFASIDPTNLWGWVGIAAAPPGAHPDEVIDGTIVALCTAPPPPEHHSTCRAVARQLGAAGGWTSLDHARWLVRLALAPQESGLAEDLLRAMLEGLVGRFDAAPHVAGLVGEMMQLNPDHPALVGLLQRWLPYAWRARTPAAFVEAVQVRGVPSGVAPLWNEFLHADR